MITEPLRCAHCGRTFDDLLAVTRAGGSVRQVGLTVFLTCPCGRKWSRAVGAAAAGRRRYWEHDR